MQPETTISPNRQKASGKTAFYLFIGALAIHLIYLSQYARSPFFEVVRMDSLYHDLLAQAILSGKEAHTVFFRAPLYYYFLAGIYRVFGHSIPAARLVHAILGSFSVVLCYRLGSRLFRPTLAVAAAIGMALYAPLIFATNELHTTVLEVLLDLMFLLLIAKTFVAVGKERLLLAGAAGLILGLSVITRPNVLVTLPIFALALWWESEVRPTEPTNRKAQFLVPLSVVALFLAGSSLAPLLVTARNYVVANDSVFVASQGGINLYLGNRPEADGFTPSTPTRYKFDTTYEDSVALYGEHAANDAAGRILTASESQRYWIGQVFAWWHSHPTDALRLLGKKWTLAWTHREIRNNTAFDYVRREWAPILWFCAVGFGIVAPLALLGMVFAWQQERKTRPFALFVFAYMFSFALFFAADRFRLPVVPLLLLFAGYGVERFLTMGLSTLKSLRNPRGYSSKGIYAKLFSALFLLLTLGIWVNVDWYQTVTPKTWALDYWSAANRYIALHRFVEAEAQTKVALSLDTANPEIWNTLGEAQYYQTHFADAEKSFTASLRLAPGNAGGFYNLALCKITQGERAAAIPLLQQALRLDPNHAAARAELAHLLRK